MTSSLSKLPIADLSTALPAANPLIVHVLEKAAAGIEIKTIVILIATSEAGTGQTEKETVLATADVTTTINTAEDGMTKVIVTPETATVHPGAVTGIAIVEGMIDATVIVVTKGDVKTVTRTFLKANEGERTGIVLPEMPGVRRGIALGNLTRGDATGIQMGDEGPPRMLMGDRRKRT